MKAGEQQRTDSTHVLARIRELNRLELAAETVRAALHALTAAAPRSLTLVIHSSSQRVYSQRIYISLPKATARPSSPCVRPRYSLLYIAPPARLAL